MVSYYDELEIEDFTWDPAANVFHYPCPCGDRFEISKAQLRDGEEIAICPSCSLIVRVVYDYLDWEDYASSEEEDDAESLKSAEDPAESPITSSSPSPTTIETQQMQAVLASGSLQAKLSSKKGREDEQKVREGRADNIEGCPAQRTSEKDDAVQGLSNLTISGGWQGQKGDEGGQEHVNK
ncbi:diphthamide biosynthesis protein 3, partial [Tremellales sp. Uapishka_1]